MKKYFSLGSAAISLIGAALIACHLQLVGLILTVLGLIGAIIAFRKREQFEIKTPTAYWSLVFCAAVMLLGLLGFAGWTVWDIYARHDVG